MVVRIRSRDKRNGAMDQAPEQPLARSEPPSAGARRRNQYTRPFVPIAWTWALILGCCVWVLFFAIWQVVTLLGFANPLLLPPPREVVSALWNLFIHQGFAIDVGISVLRVFISFLVVCVVAIPLGLVMGAYPVAEAFFNPFVSAWRYLPAPSFIPILLMWFGTGEAPKLALLFLGVIFFMITLIMDYTRGVPPELIETALTMGATSGQIFRTIVVPSTLPDIVTAMRQMLAISWTYLVIAEIVASTTGIGAMMMRSRRFLHTDDILAGIVVIGLLGLIIDALLRMAHARAFRYLVRN